MTEDLKRLYKARDYIRTRAFNSDNGIYWRLYDGLCDSLDAYYFCLEY